jgi:hypothetical protein
MPALSATVRNRRIEIEVPDDWPDGTPVRVTTEPAPTDDDGPMTPEEIAAMVARMEALEPVEWTDEERAAWDAERAARKAAEIASFDARMQELRGMWD